MVRGTRERLKALFILLGRKGWGWIVLALGTTLIQALMESLIIGALILLAYSLGILNKTQLPIWLPFRLINCKIDIILAILILLGALRAGAQSISSCTKHMILEWIRARIQRIQGFRLLMLPDLPPIAISDVHLMMSDHLNKATSWCFSGLQMITSIIIATSFFIALYFIAWRQALLALVCLPLFGLLVKYLKCYILSHAVNIPRHRSSLEQTIVRISRNRVLIKVLHLREKELKPIMMQYQPILIQVVKHSIHAT